VSQGSGNTNSYRKLLVKFVDNQANAVNDIRKALGNGDAQTAERLAHTLKGVAGTIGADVLRAEAAEIETAIKADVGAVSKAKFLRVERELEGLVCAIRGATGTGPSPGEGELGQVPEDLSMRLKGLLERLEGYDTEADEALDEILKAVSVLDWKNRLQALKKPIGQYDFEKAAEEVRDFIRLAGVDSRDNDDGG